MKTIKQKFVIDESGSMLPQQSTVISGFNEQLATMKQEEKDSDVRYLVTLVKFSDNVTVLYRDKPLAEVEELTTRTYVPKGWTALYDAIGTTIDTAVLGETDTVVVIMTDGQNNASREWNKSQIKTLIELRQNENKWGFIYFGADQNAWASASSLGVANAVSYTAANTGEAISAMSACRSSYVTTASSGAYNVYSLTDSIQSCNLTATSSGSTISNMPINVTQTNLTGDITSGNLFPTSGNTVVPPPTSKK